MRAVVNLLKKVVLRNFKYFRMLTLFSDAKNFIQDELDCCGYYDASEYQRSDENIQFTFYKFYKKSLTKNTLAIKCLFISSILSTRDRE